MDLREILTLKEAAEIWGIKWETLKKRMQIQTNLVENIDYRKAPRVWLITEKGMEKLYGPKPTN